MGLVTKNVVKTADLGKPLTLWQKFDWTLCLEVAENIPPELTPAFLRNLEVHTEHGLILSWAKPDVQGLGTANPKSEAEVLTLMQQHTGLHLDSQATQTLRMASTVPYLADSLLVFVRNPSAPTCAPGDKACLGGDACGTETGVIFAAMMCKCTQMFQLQQHVANFVEAMTIADFGVGLKRIATGNFAGSNPHANIASLMRVSSLVS